jgi:hypothetical protein
MGSQRLEGSVPGRRTVDGRGGEFSTSVWVCVALASLCLIAAFSSPGALVGVAVFGGYAYYLYSGGRDISGQMPDGTARARTWLIWAFVATCAAIGGFSEPIAFLVALPAGLYAAYLFRGGRDMIRSGHDGTRRSAAWLYYLLIALVAAGLGLSHPAVFVIALGAGAYSLYLYRGGRWVLWIW